MQEGRDVVSGSLHHPHSGGELLAQHLCDPLPVSADLIGCLNHEHRLHSGGDHVLARFGHVGEQVVPEVRPAALLAAGLEHPLDRSQAQVGIGDHQPGAIESSLVEAAQELVPEALRLAVSYGNAEHLAVAEGIDADLHSRLGHTTCRLRPRRPWRSVASR